MLDWFAPAFNDTAIRGQSRKKIQFTLFHYLIENDTTWTVGQKPHSALFLVPAFLFS